MITEASVTEASVIEVTVIDGFVEAVTGTLADLIVVDKTCLSVESPTSIWLCMDGAVVTGIAGWLSNAADVSVATAVTETAVTLLSEAESVTFMTGTQAIAGVLARSFFSAAQLLWVSERVARG